MESLKLSKKLCRIHKDGQYRCLSIFGVYQLLMYYLPIDFHQIIVPLFSSLSSAEASLCPPRALTFSFEIPGGASAEEKGCFRCLKGEVCFENKFTTLHKFSWKYAIVETSKHVLNNTPFS